MVDQKLQKIEQTLAQISLNNSLNTTPKSTLYNNHPPQSEKPPIRCYFCSRVGHIKRNCLKFQAAMRNTPNGDHRNPRGNGAQQQGTEQVSGDIC
jgi:hypothetical protein